ncbi:MAG: porin [Desulfosarcina sp.]|nr:porin [Desulfosarcina sp.]MBC2765527.1 porin [Desulfosarcina sp.]
MKKLLIIAVVIMFAAGAAYAEDRLSLNGSFRVAGWSSEAAGGWDSNDTADWWAQRLRIGGKIAVADDVAVNFRMDIGDAAWGDSFGTGYIVRPRGANGTGNANQLDVDRAYVSINKDFWELDAGQQYLGLGVAEVLDANVPALTLRIKPTEALKISLIYAKIDESGSLNDDAPFEDVDFYAVNVGFATDNLSVKGYYAQQADGTVAAEEPNVFGVYGSMALGMFNLEAELDVLGGDNAAGTDYQGTQFFLGADAGLTEMIKLGAELFYAAGYSDPGEQQITGLCDWWTFTPMGYNTPQSGNISAFSPNGTSSPFDPSGDGAGAMGMTLWADFAIMEGLKAGAKIGYWEVDDDTVTNMDSIMAYNAYVSYMIATNSNLSLTYLSSTPDFDTAGILDDSYNVGVLELMIKF